MTSLHYPRPGYEPIKRKLSGPVPESWAVVLTDEDKAAAERARVAFMDEQRMFAVQRIVQGSAS